MRELFKTTPTLLPPKRLDDYKKISDNYQDSG